MADLGLTIRRAIIGARSALINMRLDDASGFVSRIKELVSRSSRTDLLHIVPVLEASVFSLREEFLEARRVLLQLPAFHGDGLSVTLLRYLDWKLSEHADPAAPDAVDYLASPVGGKAVCRIVSLCVSAAIAFDRLQLTLSASLATEALQLGRVRYGNRSPMISLPATLLAQVAYEQGRLDEAEALLRPRLTSIWASGMPACITRASVILARISLHRGQHGFALAILRKAEALGRARRWSRLISAALSEHVRTLASAPETIKSHAKSIFAKLATRTRAQAVARAKATGELARVRAPSQRLARRARPRDVCPWECGVDVGRPIDSEKSPALTHAPAAMQSDRGSKGRCDAVSVHSSRQTGSKSLADAREDFVRSARSSLQKPQDFWSR